MIDKGAITLILILFITLGMAYSIVTPPYEATDEIRHVRYVRFMAENGRLPVQGEETCRAQGHHPPLFYAIAAVLTSWITPENEWCNEPPLNPFWAYRAWEVGDDNKNLHLFGAGERFAFDGDYRYTRIARTLNVMFGAVTVWLTWLIARRLSDRRKVAITAASLIAFNPMFLYLSGAVNNDIVAAMLGAVTLYLCVRLLQTARLTVWHGVPLGIAYSAAVMSKFNLAAVIILIEITLITVAIYQKRWLAWLGANGVMAAIIGLSTGWWFRRNVQLYGEPTGVERLTELWGVRDPSAWWGGAIREVPAAWSSLWGRFGYGQIPMPNIIYHIMVAITLIGLIGLIWHIAEHLRPSSSTSLMAHTFPLIITGGFVAGFMVVLFNYMLISPAGAMGRFFFPGYSAFVLLVAIGWERMTRRFKLTTWGVMVWPIGMIGLAVWALVAVLMPAYAEPSEFDALPDDATRIDAKIMEIGHLLGYTIEPDTVNAGEAVTLNLYWEAAEPTTNYIQFVHLIDEGGLATQRDTHTGTGAHPTGNWESGRTFIDTLTIHLPDVMYTPSSPEITLGFYDPADDQRLMWVDGNGEPLGDALPLGKIDVRPSDSPIPNPQTHYFGDQVTLVGYEYDTRRVLLNSDRSNTDDELTVTLYWEMGAADNQDLEMQLLLLNDDEAWVGSSDVSPGTLEWVQDSMYTTQHTFDMDALPVETKSGRHLIRIAVQDRETWQKEAVVKANGTYLSEYLTLASIVVIEP